MSSAREAMRAYMLIVHALWQAMHAHYTPLCEPQICVLWGEAPARRK